MRHRLPRSVPPFAALAGEADSGGRDGGRGKVETMKRLLLSIALMLSVALPTQAETITDRILAQLESQGYTVLEQNRTWLGRERILAENDEIRREIVFNPGTGEILRDYSVLLAVLEQRDEKTASKHKSSQTATATVATDTDVMSTAAQSGSGTTPDMLLGDPLLAIGE